MRSWQVHYMNKYPGGRVMCSENSVDVFDKNGAHRVSIQKGGDGMWNDQSASLGLPDRHDLAPIPKESRVFKSQVGIVGKSKAPNGQLVDALGEVIAVDPVDGESRKEAGKQFLCKDGIRIRSMEELEGEKLAAEKAKLAEKA